MSQPFEPTPPPTPPTPDSADLAARLARALAREGAVDERRVEPHVRGGVVTLRGMVSSPRQKALAESVARSVPGVETVRNRLRVEPVIRATF